MARLMTGESHSLSVVTLLQPVPLHLDPSHARRTMLGPTGFKTIVPLTRPPAQHEIVVSPVTARAATWSSSAGSGSATTPSG